MRKLTPSLHTLNAGSMIHKANAQYFKCSSFNALTFNALTVLSIKSILTHYVILSQNTITVGFLLELLASDISCLMS